jgi:drug/metabolite transporter (DMT)-like permease
MSRRDFARKDAPRMTTTHHEHVPVRPGSLSATLIGSIAILLWGVLALLTDLSGDIPPFQLVAMAFALGTVPGIARLATAQSDVRRVFTFPRTAWIVGIGGLFGYHFFYFVALRNAPPVEASLIAYLWPLLIVLFSALLPGERLRGWHVAGACLGLIGTLVLVTGGDGVSFQREYIGGYAAAMVCAVVWAGYSVLNRRFPDVPSDAVAGFCAVTAILALGCHLLLEETAWPVGRQWLAVLALGLGPIGLAFYVWDIGTKHGDIRLLGTASYFTPLLSTIALIVFGAAELTSAVLIACVLIVAGALLASRDALGPVS